MPDYATTDLTLAIAHHLLMFALAGILAFEIGVIRPDMKREVLVRVARVDLWYGILAGADRRGRVFAGGLRREGLGLYSVNISSGKDRRLCGRRSAVDRADDPDHPLAGALAGDAAFAPAAADMVNVRRFLWAEAALFALIPVFAAAMARGYGPMAQ